MTLGNGSRGPVDRSAKSNPHALDPVRLNQWRPVFGDLLQNSLGSGRCTDILPAKKTATASMRVSKVRRLNCIQRRFGLLL